MAWLQRSAIQQQDQNRAHEKKGSKILLLFVLTGSTITEIQHFLQA